METSSGVGFGFGVGEQVILQPCVARNETSVGILSTKQEEDGPA